MNLLIDIGNSRAKWTLATGLQLQAQRAVALPEFTADYLQTAISDWAEIERTLVSNVGGSSLQVLIQRVVRERTGREPEFLHSTSAAAGVRNAYTVPAHLGVDRWLAMIGAKQLYSEPLCVVSVGTAMTIDVINRTGEHRGGLIIPGAKLMISSLLANTSEIAERAKSGQRADQLLAIDTLDAITKGAEHAMAALIERVLRDAEADLHQPLRLILTGGASGMIEPLISVRPLTIPDLVLRGLAVMSNIQPLDSGA